MRVAKILIITTAVIVVVIMLYLKFWPIVPKVTYVPCRHLECRWQDGTFVCRCVVQEKDNAKELTLD